MHSKLLYLTALCCVNYEEVIGCFHFILFCIISFHSWQVGVCASVYICQYLSECGVAISILSYLYVSYNYAVIDSIIRINLSHFVIG